MAEKPPVKALISLLAYLRAHVLHVPTYSERLSGVEPSTEACFSESLCGLERDDCRVAYLLIWVCGTEHTTLGVWHLEGFQVMSSGVAGRAFLIIQGPRQ